jgi:transcription elongation factor
MGKEGEGSVTDTEKLIEAVARRLHEASKTYEPGVGMDEWYIGWPAMAEEAVAAVRRWDAANGLVTVPRAESEAMGMAGYAVSCKYGVLEARAFDLSEQMWDAHIGAAPPPPGAELEHQP